MKNTVLILTLQLMLAAFSGYARGSEGAPAKELLPLVHETSAQSGTPEDGNTIPREGDAIWLEEKIARPTRWIENLVKPLTTWMEGKVQRSGEVKDVDQPNYNFETSILPSGGDLGRTSGSLTSRDASELARQLVPGHVLVAKLLSAGDGELYYRVKLISDIGEIHIFYINERTGELMQSGKPPAASQEQEVR